MKANFDLDRWRQRAKSAVLGLMFSYAHLPLVGYVALREPSPGLWMLALLPQLGMALPFVLMTVLLSIGGAALIEPSDPTGYLSTHFPRESGEALVGLPALLVFVPFYAAALLRVQSKRRLARGWIAFIVVWSVSTNALAIPAVLRNDAVRATYDRRHHSNRAEHHHPADAQRAARR